MRSSISRPIIARALGCVPFWFALAGCPPGDKTAPTDDSESDTGDAEETGTPDESGTPDETGTPDESGTPDETGTPDESGTPDETGTPTETGSPETGTPDDTGPADSGEDSDPTADLDADGYPAAVDCDDADPDVHPDALESCNGRDDDCDGEADEADAIDPSTWYRDADGDGYGDASVSIEACATAGYVADDTDCDDTRAASHPGGTEVLDGVDDTCDGRLGAFYVTDADALVTGANAEDEIGRAIGADDLDGDGVTDLVVGSDAQRGAFVLHGPVSGTTSLSTGVALTGSLWATGYNVDTAGDMDGDGYGDVAVGHLSDAGGAYVVPGPFTSDLDLDTDAWLLSGVAGYDYAGTSFAPVGDLDSDGYDDLIIGTSAKDSTNGPFLVLGPVTASASLSTADATWTCASASDMYGAEIANAGDIDADGQVDMVIGAPAADAVYVFTGPLTSGGSTASADITLTAESGSDDAGTEVDGAGDVDGDGYDDLVIGASSESTAADGAGAAYLVRGPAAITSLAAADAKMLGENKSDRAGYSVSGVGDVNGDGLAEFTVGAYSYGSTNVGRAYVVSAPTSGTWSLASAETLTGNVSSAYLGIFDSLAGGDVSGDGTSDLIFGTIGDDTGGNDAGALAIFVGQP